MEAVAFYENCVATSENDYEAGNELTLSGVKTWNDTSESRRVVKNLSISILIRTG